MSEPRNRGVVLAVCVAMAAAFGLLAAFMIAVGVLEFVS
jgi:hypothetical protein